MTTNEKPDEAVVDNREDASAGMSRRAFVRRTAAGVAALSVARTGSAFAHGPQADLPVNPATAAETWDEPWVWRPGDFPGASLQMNIVEHENPTVVVGLGNPGAALFTYNGSTPGPTVRMKGDETLLVQLVNHLGLNAGRSPVGPAPDLAAYLQRPPTYPDGVILHSDWCLGEHTNGLHSAHTTNLHTHGLHVRPGVNPDGTHSDDIFVRLIPRADFQERERTKGCDSLNDDYLLEDEVVAKGDWEFRLGDVMGNADEPHPPGTHWYHPHPHGATHNEVSSGMAGFLIVEGDVDERINQALTTRRDPPPDVKTGLYDYRERLMLIQRVNPAIVSKDPDSPSKRLQNAAIPTVNGEARSPVITMRPGAIERWRVLNGSVDGKGYLRFMVLEGQWVSERPPSTAATPIRQCMQNARTVAELVGCQKQLLRVDEFGRRTVPTTVDIERAKAHLYQLAVDGVTLVRQSGNDDAEYCIKDLNFDADPSPLRQDFSNLGACYKDGATLKACYDRPNEFYMAPANRTDMLFQAPCVNANETAKVYTVLAKATAIHTENLQRVFQLAEQDLGDRRTPSLNLPADTIVAYLVVRNTDAQGNPLTDPNGDPLPPIPDYDVGALNDALPPVPPYLQPITDAELRITEQEAQVRGIDQQRFRTRVVTYSGWGSATWPRLHPKDLVKWKPDGPELGPINSVYLRNPTLDVPALGEVTAITAGLSEQQAEALRNELQAAVKSGDLDLDVGEWVLPADLRSMAIDGRKFDPDDPLRPRMLVGTAEEWSVRNNSVSLFGPLGNEHFDVSQFVPHDTPQRSKIVANINDAIFQHLRDFAVGYPKTRKQADDSGWLITTRGIDHPFHVHTNPFWLMRIEVPDENGNLVNVLDAPRWQDVIWVPRNAGRVVFRSRYPDFVGKLVNHCHILLHEDNGMMQPVEIVPKAAESNYQPSTTLMGTSTSAPVSAEALGEAYKQCSRFIDPNKLRGRGQEYPSTNGVFAPPTD